MNHKLTTPIALPIGLADSLKTSSHLEGVPTALYIDLLLGRYSPRLKPQTPATVLGVARGTGRRSIPCEWVQLRIPRGTAARLRRLGAALAHAPGARLSIVRTLYWLLAADAAANSREVC